MLVYGDPEFGISAAGAESALARLAGSAQASLDAARAFLIACGQCEQGVADAGLPSAEFEGATDAAAEAFLAHLKGEPVPPPFPLPKLASAGTLRIKIPEGFAFYCLYPEQYIAAANAWSANRPASRVTIVGLRSIGTTLSAIVAAVLRPRGFAVERRTVRPDGDPFSRSVQLPHLSPAPAIVVDEGPGLSGSSIACVVRVLKSAGVHVMSARNLGVPAAAYFQAGPPSPQVPLSGDGRPAPHEWIRAGNGRLYRTDVWRHDCDHTWIGPQPIHWDVAGTILHWKMDEGASAKLLRCLARHGIELRPPDLTPYLTAWRAFQAGLRTFAAGN